jgi:hypothetical protein
VSHDPSLERDQIGVFNDPSRCRSRPHATVNGRKATEKHRQIAEEGFIYGLPLVMAVTRHSNRGKCTVRPRNCIQIAEFRACLYSNRGQSGLEPDAAQNVSPRGVREG